MSSASVCGLRMTVRIGLVKCFRKVDTLLHSGFVTKVASSDISTPKGHETAPTKERKSFYAVQAERQEQAQRSVLISCPPKVSERTIKRYLSRYGDIKKFFAYESFGIYAVVEYASSEGVASLLDSAAIPNVSHESLLPYKSRLVSFKHHGSMDSSGPHLKEHCQALATISINEVIKRLSREESIDQQITSLTEAHQLTEENIRLRFLVCSLLKDMAAAYFPGCAVRPFGSSVNGFGKMGCDLDMFLDLDRANGKDVKLPASGLTLEYQMKVASSERAVTQSILSVIGECVDQFGPGCVGVQKILSARCPLVRFSHQPSGFQCDLTANNRVAMKSSELLYLYGELDPRVRHLVFTVRCWARAHCITSSIPGAWISNFSLTVMVLFFLQKRNIPIIPTLDHLRDLAGPADKSVIEGNDCTFVSDLSSIQLQGNTETLEELLCEFFEFYATFPFSKKSINVRKGKEQNKPEVSPLHIQNPFETSLNVSKNVNVAQLDRFVALCQESLWLLRQSEFRTPSNHDMESSPYTWGLATLILPSHVAGTQGRRKKLKEPTSERIKSLLESLKRQTKKK